MLRSVMMVVALGVAVALVSSAAAADEKKAEVKATCPVSGKAIDKEVSAAYKDGKVYFCCPACPEPFKKDTAKFAAKANLQLVATGQYEQVKCAFTGMDLNPATAIDVKGVKVAFCCNMCKGKAVEAKDQVELIFTDKGFDKGFKAKKK